jgi:proline iminopeptidase
MHLIAAGNDIRPVVALGPACRLVPYGKFSTVPGVPHDLWFTHPEVWTKTFTDACAASAASIHQYGSNSVGGVLTCWTANGPFSSA